MPLFYLELFTNTINCGIITIVEVINTIKYLEE